MRESDPLRKSLERAVFAAVENIVFEEPETLAEPVDIGENTIVFSLQVVAPYLLQARIEIPRELAAKLTRTIYRDAEKDISDALLDDTVGEFLNTIIGTMMGDLTLGERIFEMGLPQKIDREKESSAPNSRKTFFRIDEYPFCIEIAGDAFLASK